MSRFLLFSFCGSLQIVSIDVMHQKQKTQQKNDNSLARSRSTNRLLINEMDECIYMHVCVRTHMEDGRYIIEKEKKIESMHA